MKTHPLSPASPAPHSARGLVSAVTIFGVLGLLAGCATGPSSEVVSYPPPAPPITNPGYTTGPSQPVVVVTQAPPAVQQETVSVRPSLQHVWVPGYWTWRDNRYQWVAGHWEIPPRAGAVWVAPRLDQEGNGYRFYEGYWN